MFSKVLVGVDGRFGGRDAIALARQLCAEDGQLVLAHIYPVHGDPLHRDYSDHEAAEYVHARDLLMAAREDAGVGAELRWSACTAPGRGLHELAESLRSDLLVVGSCGRGLLGRAMIGDDTRAALDGAPCAVAVAPAGYAQHPKPIEKIGVGYDGFPDSQRALDAARTLAGGLHATVAALEVVAYPAWTFRAPDAGDDAAVGELVNNARDRVAALGDVEPHGAYGHPAEELARWGDLVDLLVVGSRGYGPVGRLVHGSTSRGLLRSAHCPLLVLSRPRAAPSPQDLALEDRALAPT
ncbi:MAG TPA: universal stress protein [Solirubrobacteraceae bacterium]|nr:universal stress protein [Solirubrobacteraceae bacterium]